MKFFPKKFFLKVSLTNMIFGVMAILSTAFITRSYLNDFFEQQLGTQIYESLSTLRRTLIRNHLPPLQWCLSLQQSSSESLARYTLVDSSGKVLCDTKLDWRSMGNHSFRPEIQKAFQVGQGSQLRYSESSKTKFFYGAILMPWEKEGPYVIRKAVPMEAIDKALQIVDHSIVIILIPLFLIFSTLSLLRGIHLARPLAMLLEKVKLLGEHGQQQSEWEVLEKAIDDASQTIRKQTQGLGMERMKLSSLLNSLSDAIVAVDKNQNLLFYNPVFYKTFLKNQLSTPSSTLISIQQIFQQQEILNAFQTCLQEGKTVRLRKIEFKEFLEFKEKGTQVQQDHQQYFSLVVNPLRNEEKSESAGVVAVFYNMTKIHLLNQMRVDFVANISHEVRTPLTSIKGSLDLIMMKKGDLTPFALKYLEKISKNTERLIALFQDLLKLSLLESEVDLFPELVELKSLLEQIVEVVQTAYPDKKVNVTIECEVEMANLDKNLFEQILVNLLENSFKYACSTDGEKEEGRIEVKLRSYEKGILLSVRDHGPGISPEHKDRVFERFYRVERSRSQVVAGTGLGLSIVKHAALRHLGRVWLESQLGKGANFNVYLPDLL